MAGRARGLSENAAARIGPHATAALLGDDAAPTAASSPAGAGAPGPSGILGALTAAAEAPPEPGERIVNLPLAELAPWPDNIRPDPDQDPSLDGYIDALADSIKEHGVENPLRVVTRAAMLNSYPDLTLAPEIGWVIVEGHCRRLAAYRASLTVVPALIRDRLAGEDEALTAMLLENCSRRGLSPLEEARAFMRARRRGWLERQIAVAAGRAPGQVNKRLKLLRLPERLQTAMSAGELTISDSLELLRLPDDQVAPAWEQAKREKWREVRGVVEARLAAIASPPPQMTFTEAGAVLAHTSGSAAPPARPASTGSSREEAPAPESASRPVDRAALNATLQRVERGPRPAQPVPARPAADPAPAPAPEQTPAELRADACRRVLIRALDDTLAAEILADHTLVGSVPADEDLLRAAEWCQARNAMPTWAAEQATASRGRARRAAAAVALAAMETTLARAEQHRRSWTAGEARHVQRLARIGGYELTEQDQEQIAAASDGSRGATG